MNWRVFWFLDFPFGSTEKEFRFSFILFLRCISRKSLFCSFLSSFVFQHPISSSTTLNLCFFVLWTNLLLKINLELTTLNLVLCYFPFPSRAGRNTAVSVCFKQLIPTGWTPMLQLMTLVFMDELSCMELQKIVIIFLFIIVIRVKLNL